MLPLKKLARPKYTWIFIFRTSKAPLSASTYDTLQLMLAGSRCLGKGFEGTGHRVEGSEPQNTGFRGSGLRFQGSGLGFKVSAWVLGFRV